MVEALSRILLIIRKFDISPNPSCLDTMFSRDKVSPLVLWAALLTCSTLVCESKRTRLPIPTSLLVYDAKGTNVINSSVELARTSNIFPEDYNFARRIAIVEATLNKSSNEGGLWNVDKCAFRGITQNKRKYPDLAAIQKSVRRIFGITWSKIRHTDLRRPLYSLLAARIYLAITVPNPPRGLRHQGRVWSQNYHQCVQTGENKLGPDEIKRLEDKFVKGNQTSLYISVITVFL